MADLFLAAKIEETAKQSGVPTKPVTDLDAVQKGDTLIVDIEKANPDKLADVAKGAKVVAFVSHVDMAKYKKYGKKFTLMTKSQLSEKLPELLAD